MEREAEKRLFFLSQIIAQMPLELIVNFLILQATRYRSVITSFYA